MRILLSALILIVTTNASAQTLLFTADGEGHVGPCQTCPLHTGLGGLARRATLVAGIRSDPTQSSLLLDGGNSLFGEQSLDSRGKVILAAFDALNYDALNLTYKDFLLGKDITLADIATSKTPVVSANIFDDTTGKLITSPFAVRSVGDKRIAILGVTETPAGLDYLPEWKQKLAGLRFQSPMDALVEWIPKARAQADAVVVLYYGAPAAVTEIRSRFGSQILAIAAGGIEPQELPANPKPDDTAPPVLTAEKHGRTVARLEFQSKSREVVQLPVEPKLAPDPHMLKVLAEFSPLAPAAKR